VREGKAFVHANCVFVDDEIQVNESDFTVECCILVLFDTSLESESVILYSKPVSERR
jgi:hypothetical protein